MKQFAKSLSSVLSAPRRSIRGRLGLFTVLLMGLIAGFIFLFFPMKLRLQALDSIATTATTLTEMTAYVLATPMVEDDYAKIEEFVTTTAHFEDVVYAFVVSADGVPVTSYNREPTRFPIDSELGKTSGPEHETGIYRVRRAIADEDGKLIGTVNLGYSLASLTAVIDNVRTLIAYVSILVFVFGLAGVYAISYVITEPLGRMVDAAGKLASGDFDVRVDTTSNDEVGHLAESFNQMVDSLETAYQNLEGANLNLSRHSRELQLEVSERMRAEVALRESEERFRAVVEHATDVVIIVDKTGELLYISPASVGMLGYEPDELVGTDIIRHIHKDDQGAARAALIDNLPDISRIVKVEARFQHMNGSWRYLALHGRNLEGQVGVNGTLLNMSDISEIKRYQNDLVVAKETAEEMVRLKDSFLANMSHEIRTPLTGILGFAQVLSAEVEDDQKELVTFIQDGGNRLLSTLNSVLDLAQLQANAIELHRFPMDVCTEVHNSAQLLEPLAKLNGVDFIIDLPEDPLVAQLDQKCLNRIVTNLVSNAIKFTDSGSITVCVQKAGDRIEVKVVDTGVGIGADFVPFLFDEFKQESTGLSRSHEGSGLGLAITRRLVELMDGTITVDSRKGKGSDFTVSFPLSTSSPVARSRKSGDRPPVTLGYRPHILVVEDNPDTRLLIKKILQTDFEVTITESSAKALEASRTAAFDLVLMDISLGDGNDGAETMKTLRGQAIYKSTPIIAVTAYALPGDRVRFLNEGFNDYLSKPFRKEDLLDIIRRNIAKREVTVTQG